MNTVGPYHNRQETYSFFTLPFCRGPLKHVSHHHESIGEALQGTELEFSGLEIKFKGKLSLLPHVLLLIRARIRAHKRVLQRDP